MADLDRVIHEPARLLVVALLRNIESADFVFLLKETGLTKGNLSSHLSKLEEAGYVAIDKTYRGKIPLTLIGLTLAGQEAFDSYKRQIGGLLARAGGPATDNPGSRKQKRSAASASGPDQVAPLT
ncbi:MAG: ArsR family transcriptional regulator [Candidatus Solibacter sp.]|nr:ArsR family transcriptional regulator [Candidatus Solibacter sp.]